jgi:hypothetical protein
VNTNWFCAKKNSAAVSTRKRKGLIMNEKLNDLVAELDSKIKFVQSTLDKFRKYFDINPAHALEQSMQAFEAAGTLRLCQTLKQEIAEAVERGESETFLAQIQRHCQGKMYRGARWPTRSTSITSNLMEQCDLAAHAELYDTITKFLK